MGHSRDRVSGNRFARLLMNETLFMPPAGGSRSQTRGKINFIRGCRTRCQYGSMVSGSCEPVEMDAPRLLQRAKLVDREVATICYGSLIVGNDERVHFDEAMSILFVVAGDTGARRQFIAASCCRE